MKLTPDCASLLTKIMWIIALAMIALSGESLAETGDVIAELGPGSLPQWSPDGTRIAFVQDGYLQVTLVDSSSASTRISAYHGHRFIWTTDSELVFVERPSKMSDTSVFKKVVAPTTVELAVAQVVPVELSNPAPVRTVVDGSNSSHRVFGPVVLVDGTVGYFVSSGALAGDPAQFVSTTAGQVPTQRELDWPRIVTRRASDSRTIWGDLWLSRIGDSIGPGRQLRGSAQATQWHALGRRGRP